MNKYINHVSCWTQIDIRVCWLVNQKLTFSEWTGNFEFVWFKVYEELQRLIGTSILAWNYPFRTAHLPRESSEAIYFAITMRNKFVRGFSASLETHFCRPYITMETSVPELRNLSTVTVIDFGPWHGPTSGMKTKGNVGLIDITDSRANQPVSHTTVTQADLRPWLFDHSVPRN